MLKLLTKQNIWNTLDLETGRNEISIDFDQAALHHLVLIYYWVNVVWLSAINAESDYVISLRKEDFMQKIHIQSI